MYDHIEVQFIDAATDETLYQAVIPYEQLPEDFTLATHLSIGGVEWQVELAEPPNRAAFRESGRLVLRMRRIQLVKAGEILFSLPTITDSIPASNPDDPIDGMVFTLHEDDWRQLELVSETYLEQVAYEMRRIEAIYNDHATDSGFKQLHVRKLIPHGLNGELSLSQLYGCLPPDSDFDAVAFGANPDRLQDVFAWNMSPLIIYAHVVDQRVASLGIARLGNQLAVTETSLTALACLAEERNLVLVDWLSLVISPPTVEALRHYFATAL